MDFRGMEPEFGSWRFHAAARKLLAGKAEPTPAALAPSSAYMCRDVKTGAAVACQNPHTLIIIVAGMSCMMFLVTIAMLLLCWSVVRQRRLEQRRRESSATESSSSAAPQAADPAPPVDSPEFDDAVFVQLPGDEKPQFFALPKPLHAAEDLHHHDAKTTTEVIKNGEKDDHVEDACVPSSDGLFRNPLFAPR